MSESPRLVVRTLKWKKHPWGVYSGHLETSGPAFRYVHKSMLKNRPGYFYGEECHDTLVGAIGAAQKSFEAHVLQYLEEVK